MILAVDIGNTHIVCGALQADKVIFKVRMATDTQKTADEYTALLKQLLKLKIDIDGEAILGGIISSVVPCLTGVLQTALKNITTGKVLVVGAGVKTGLNILVDNPAQLGSDLVVGAVAAIKKYKPPLLVIDLGTATTCSLIDKNASYIGCMIIPGVFIGTEALAAKTSQLQHISIDKPQKMFCSNTIESMKSGAVYGTAAMLDGIIARAKESLKNNITVIATGGMANTIIPCCQSNIAICPDLMLEGLNIIYNKNVL